MLNMFHSYGYLQKLQSSIQTENRANLRIWLPGGIWSSGNLRAEFKLIMISPGNRSLH